jgi:hypothetical protein
MAEGLHRVHWWLNQGTATTQEQVMCVGKCVPTELLITIIKTRWPVITRACMISAQIISFTLQLLNHVYVGADANCAVIGIELHGLFPRVQREPCDLVERIQDTKLDPMSKG